MATKRRKRRTATERLAQQTIKDVKARKRAFLKDVSKILSDALGFEVRVALVAPNPKAGFSPDMRRASRLSKKDARQQIRDAFAPLDFGEEPTGE